MRLTSCVLMSVALVLSACGGGKSASERRAAQAQTQTCSPASPSKQVGPGVTYYDCSLIDPAVHVVTIERTLRGYHLRLLADSTEKLDTLNLRDLRTLARDNQATVAINGYFWNGDLGIQCEVFACAKGTPKTTTFFDGVRRTLPSTSVDKEVLMGFTADNASGIQARRILQDDLFNPENRPYRQWLYGAEKTVMADGVFVGQGGSTGFQSLLGYSPTHILFLTTSHAYSLEQLASTLAAFGVTDAVLNDGGSSAGIYIGGGVGKLEDPTGQARKIPYAIGLVAGLPDSPPSAQGNDMQPGQRLNPGESLRSANGVYQLTYQTDGNLVLSRTSEGKALWATNTAGKRGFCILQPDGSLVLQDVNSQPVWSSRTENHPGSQLLLRDDGNVVISGPDGEVVWATNTSQ